MRRIRLFSTAFSTATLVVQRVTCAKPNITLIGILLLGLVLRYAGIADHSLWLDEGSTLQLAGAKLSDLFDRVSRCDTSPPLYYVLLHFWINCFGQSEFSLRFLSLIFGFLGLWAIYAVGRALINQRTGLVAAFLFALSSYHIKYSQEGRMYSLLVFLTLVSFLSFARLCLGKSKSALFSYAASGVLLTWTHIGGWMVLLAQNVYLVFASQWRCARRLPDIKCWIMLQGMLIVFYLPWLPYLAKMPNIFDATSWIPNPSFHSIIRTFTLFAGSPLCLVVFSFCIVWPLLGQVQQPTHRGDSQAQEWPQIDRIILLTVWMIVPVALPFLLSKAWTPLFWPRYTITALPAFYLLVANGVSHPLGQKWFRVLGGCLIVVVSLVSLMQYYSREQTEQWRDVARYLDANAGHKDTVVFHAGYCRDLVFNYYSRRTDLEKISIPEKGALRQVDVDRLRREVKGQPRVWLVMSHGHDSKKLIVRGLSNMCRLAMVSHYQGIDLYLFLSRV